MNYTQNLAPGFTLRHTKSGSKNSGSSGNLELAITEITYPRITRMGVSAKATISFNLSEARDRDRVREIARTLLKIVGEA